MNAIFVTNEYKVLEIMCSHMINVANEKYCPLNQGDIAKELQLSRAVVNKIFTELKNEGYISMITRGKWTLSNKAIKMIKVAQNIQ